MKRRGFLKALLVAPVVGLAASKKAKAEPLKVVVNPNHPRRFANLKLEDQPTLLDLARKHPNSDTAQSILELDRRMGDDRRFIARMSHEFVRKLLSPKGE